MTISERNFCLWFTCRSCVHIVVRDCNILYLTGVYLYHHVCIYWLLQADVTSLKTNASIKCYSFTARRLCFLYTTKTKAKQWHKHSSLPTLFDSRLWNKNESNMCTRNKEEFSVATTLTNNLIKICLSVTNELDKISVVLIITSSETMESKMLSVLFSLDNAGRSLLSCLKY